MTIALSICIPTYNRSSYLRECLDSILLSVAGHEHEIEIVISNNASTDGTEGVIREYLESYPWMRYNLNETNIGADRNFFLLASLAIGDNIWMFGDDDKMESNAVLRVLENIRAGYSLTICNYSLWDKQFAVQIARSALAGENDCTIKNPNELLKRFGLHIGYISAVVINRSILFKLPLEERESFVGYGFPLIYAIYAGVANSACELSFIAEPLLRNRGGNSGDYDWYKYFVTGSSLIFDELLYKGYTKSAVQVAKRQVLNDFVVPNVISMKLQINHHENKQILNSIFKHYKSSWLFWARCVPIIIAPSFLLRFAKNTRHQIRRLNGVKSLLRNQHGK